MRRIKLSKAEIADIKKQIYRGAEYEDVCKEIIARHRGEFLKNLMQKYEQKNTATK